MVHLVIVLVVLSNIKASVSATHLNPLLRQSAPIEAAGVDVLANIASFQSFDEQCKCNRISKQWQEYIHLFRGGASEKRLDYILQILSAVNASVLAEAISAINSSVYKMREEAGIDDSMLLKYCQSLPKMVSIIQSMKDPKIKTKLLIALDLNIPNVGLSPGPTALSRTQIETLLQVSRVLLLHYFLPNEFILVDDPLIDNSIVSTELIAMCLFAYNTLMDRLYLNASLGRLNAKCKYSDLVIPLNQKIMKELEKRIFSEIASFDVSKQILETKMTVCSDHKVKFVAEDINVAFEIDFYGAQIWNKSVEQLIEKQTKWKFKLTSTNREYYAMLLDEYPSLNITLKDSAKQQDEATEQESTPVCCSTQRRL